MASFQLPVFLIGRNGNLIRCIQLGAKTSYFITRIKYSENILYLMSASWKVKKYLSFHVYDLEDGKDLMFQINIHPNVSIWKSRTVNFICE